MRPGSSLGFALFCWVFGEVVAYNHWGFIRGEAELWRYRRDPSLGQPRTFSQLSPWVWVDVSQLQAAVPLHPVAVQCQEAQVVVTVHRDLFGTGRLVRAAELSLGSATCLPTVWSAAESTVTFVAGLHECGSIRVTPDALIYSTSLNYNPVLTGNPVVIRTSPAVVPIECHYPRRDNVSSHGVKPTWAPFQSTISSEEKLPFSLHLMNDDWECERVSTVFQLGEVLHFQASVNTENHAPLRLFVDKCVATLTQRGALLPSMLSLTSVDYITCHLKVSLADQAPDPLNKACSFNKANNL
ncbi:LOW QUALITY PROTEIN: zona pellucida sperm-binding protein 3-like [Pterocles gutturalis]